MKELVIISGKGGTGKTSLIAAFASLAQDKVLCDADVDAADLHLITQPQVLERHAFQSGHTAAIDPERCTRCGLCRDLCRFDAIGDDLVVDAIACEGCGVCYYCCPEKAVDFPVNTCGEWFVSATRFGPMAHARLGIAEENSGKLVTLVRKKGQALAEAHQRDLLLTDGPPGIGCPVIASMGGATAVLIVAEPTVSGRHDMERVAELAAFFKVPAMLCVNKFDLNPEQCRGIEESAAARGVTVLDRVPFDPVFTRAMIQARTVIEYAPDSPGALAAAKIWRAVERAL